MPANDVDELLAELKEEYPFPSGQGNYTDEKVVDLFNRVQRKYVAPLLIAEKEEYLTYYEDQTISSAVLKYEIPKRAIGNKVRKVQILNSDGTEVSERRSELGRGSGYWMQGAYVVFDATMASNYNGKTLRIWFHRLLNDLVYSGYTDYTASVGVRYVDSISTYAITMNAALPTAWTSGKRLDVISQDNPYQVKGTLTISSVATPVVTVNAFSGFTIDEDDWIATEGTTPIPCMPVDFMGLITMNAAMRIASKLGFNSRYQTILNDYQNLVKSLSTIMKNRNEGNLVNLRPPRDSLI